MSNKEKTCAERVQYHFEDRMRTLRDLWGMEDQEAYHEEHETNLQEYGLSFDYVPAEDDKRGYWRYQLSTGGPGDEFRIYGEVGNEYSVSVDRIEYWFLDWFDGAHVELDGDDFEWFRDFFDGFFVDAGSAWYVRQQAIEE